MNDLKNNPPTLLNTTQIVFPSDKSGVDSTVQPIIYAEDLCIIVEAGYDARRGLNVARVQRLVDWNAKIPCHEFYYNNLGKAVDTLKGLLREP